MSDKSSLFSCWFDGGSWTLEAERALCTRGIVSPSDVVRWYEALWRWSENKPTNAKPFVCVYERPYTRNDAASLLYESLVRVADWVKADGYSLALFFDRAPKCARESSELLKEWATKKAISRVLQKGLATKWKQMKLQF